MDLFEELRFGKTFEVNLGEACMRRKQWNLDFGHELNMSSKKITENLGRFIY
jgi:hypothetical protein